MICLLVDTSHLNACLALYTISEASGQRKLKCIATEEWTGTAHSSFITVAFQRILKVSSLRPTDIECLVLGQGPGRFTGLRVAFAFIKTMAYVLNLPVHTCPSLRIWAQPCLKERKEPVLVLLNAFKNSMFGALYQRKGSVTRTLVAPIVMLPQDLDAHVSTKCLCVGDAYDIYKKHIPHAVHQKLEIKEYIPLKACYFALVVEEELHKMKKVDWKNLQPTYLRSPVSEFDVQKNN